MYEGTQHRQLLRQKKSWAMPSKHWLGFLHAWMVCVLLVFWSKYCFMTFNPECESTTSVGTRLFLRKYFLAVGCKIYTVHFQAEFQVQIFVTRIIDWDFFKKGRKFESESESWAKLETPLFIIKPVDISLDSNSEIRETPDKNCSQPAFILKFLSHETALRKIEGNSAWNFLSIWPHFCHTPNRFFSVASLSLSPKVTPRFEIRMYMWNCQFMVWR